MSFKHPVDRLTIEGFKSLRKVENLELSEINILIGSNGAGNSNFISFFRMLSEMIAGRLQSWTRKQGSSDRILSFGVKETEQINASIRFGLNGYDFTLEPTVDGGFVFHGVWISHLSALDGVVAGA